MTANPCSTIVGGKPCDGGGGGGDLTGLTSLDGSVTIVDPNGPVPDLSVAVGIVEITSDDGSIIVDNPNGPIVDLSFAGAGGSGGFEQALVTAPALDIASGVWTNISGMTLVLGAFDWFLSFSAASSHDFDSDFRIRLAANGLEIPGTVRQLRVVPMFALLMDEDIGIQLVYTVPAGIETITAQVIRDAGVGPFNVGNRVLSALLLGGAPPP